MKNKLPNFLIVGAAKSGTSSLHNYLNQHPEIFMPSYNKEGVNVKEPQFFVKERVQERLHFGIWDWKSYTELFANVKEQKCIGEASVFYLYYSKESIKNIKKYLGSDVKIIMILRNPVDRAYSAFKHVSKGLKENSTFENSLSIEEERFSNNSTITPMIRYKDMGLYYRMVKDYISNFNNVHIILYDDFLKNTALQLRKTYRFLGVDESIIVDHSVKYNLSGLQWNNKYIKSIILGENFVKKILRNFIKGKSKQFIWYLLSIFYKRKKPAMHKKTKKYLLDFYTEDIIKLSKIIKRDLSVWLK